MTRKILIAALAATALGAVAADAKPMRHAGSSGDAQAKAATRQLNEQQLASAGTPGMAPGMSQPSMAAAPSGDTAPMAPSAGTADPAMGPGAPDAANGPMAAPADGTAPADSTTPPR